MTLFDGSILLRIIFSMTSRALKSISDKFRHTSTVKGNGSTAFRKLSFRFFLNGGMMGSFNILCRSLGSQTKHLSNSELKTTGNLIQGFYSLIITGLDMCLMDHRLMWM